MPKRTELGNVARVICSCGWKAPIAVGWNDVVVAVVVRNAVMAMICPECQEELIYPLLIDPVPVRLDPNDGPPTN